LSQAKQHSAGWYAGAAVFWLLSAWIITVGLSSIIPQIFHPEASHAAGTGSCAAQLRGLTGELLTRTSAAIARAPQKGERETLTEWLARWDDRLLAAKPDCTKHELPAWDELSRLRHGMRGLVDRFDHEQAPRVRKLDALVGALPDAQAP
jgi:hypothetical protein